MYEIIFEDQSSTCKKICDYTDSNRTDSADKNKSPNNADF